MTFLRGFEKHFSVHIANITLKVGSIYLNLSLTDEKKMSLAWWRHHTISVVKAFERGFSLAE